MLKKIMDVRVNYSFLDNDSKTTIVLLHGWGQNIEMMIPLGEKIGREYNFLYVDLPGFGSSDEPSYPWDVYTYSKCVNELITSLKLNKVILIGHSFGGRIALIYSSIYKVEKIVLLASPFRKEIERLSMKTRIYKRLKTIPGLKWISNIMKNKLGSTDYKNASEVMKGVLVKSINIDMIDDIKKIKCPALLIWGTKDTAVKIERAYELRDLLKDSKLISYENATHYAYLEHINEVANEIKEFIK